VVYVYAVTEPEAVLPGTPGFGGAPLRMVGTDALGAVVCDLDEAVDPSEAALWDHEAVVEELMAGGALLPMRFGSTMTDDAAVAALLREREPELGSGLSRVRGAVELGVRAMWEADEPTGGELAAVEAESEPRAGSAGPGMKYMMRRLGITRRFDALVEGIHEPLERLARASTRRVLTAPRTMLIAAYLVDEADVDEFRAAAEELDERTDAAAVLCTGPWPPYSFAPTEAAR
jgi:hypothetical protein